MPTDPTSAALTVIDLAREGRFIEIRDMFTPGLRPMASPETLQAAWSNGLDRHGPISSVGTPVSEPADAGTTVVRVPVAFEQESMTVIVSVSHGWLTGIQLAPASAALPTEPWQPPPYADPDAFDERDVTVGEGTLAVGATLSLPRGAGPRSAVVLLPGSGPLDRDETTGRNKPLKDLAWGLASLGVAVLRFDKVTYTHREQLADLPDFTVSDEYVPHALAAVQLLEAHPGIDADRVFVLGHSLGGTVAPRVAVAAPSIAGLVILAGGVQPLQWAAVRQVSYIASLDPASADAARPVIEAMTRQAELVDSAHLTSSTPSGDLPFGVPASYWLDLRGYHPVEVAAAVAKPMLIVQGGRDYQVTVADDLARWQAGLTDRPDVTIRVYDHDNHVFFAGSGPSTPAEYEPAQHMDPAVVRDVAGWLTDTRLREES